MKRQTRESRRSIVRNAWKAAVGLSIGVLSTVAVAADPIRIGLVTTSTGPGSYLGGAEEQTIKLMAETINKQGGVLGRRIELVHYDDGTNADRARTLMQRLVTEDRVSLVIGSSTTPSTLSMADVATRGKVPLISMAGAKVLTEPLRPWLFVIPENDVMALGVMFDHLARHKLTNVALLSSTSGFGRAAREVALELSSKRGDVKVVADETYAAGDTDMSAQLTRIRGNAQVQAVINLDFGNQPAIVTRNHAALGIKAPLYLSHSTAAPKYPELAGPASEGARLAVPSLMVVEQLPDSAPEKAKALEFRNLYQASYKELPHGFHGYGYDALLVAVDAIKRAGSVDRQALRDAIEKTAGLAGVTGEYNYSPTNHGGYVPQSKLRMAEIRNGKFVLID
ncbi:ABC transporter substrate-binding protein [Thauera sinica]|uniref:ABC transporter substrate-binding protein n=1 Tax=Thauera sinica TaxID=2665146 RepID=A0ABW1AP64_9RHOO|nr:ABC transporter substrate-binding protein [Thauera sp. K11]